MARSLHLLELGAEMQTGKGRRAGRRRAAASAAGSWAAIVAATTLGDAADAVRAEIRAEGLDARSTYRLVVQSYDGKRDPVSGRAERPVGSLQRAVTGDELRQGIHVSVVEIRQLAAGQEGGDDGRPMLLAWVEAGQPDLEFDGRTARPRPGSVYGVSRRAVRSGSVIQVSLNRTLAA